MTCDILPIHRNLSPTQRTLIIKDSRRGTQLSNLTIIQERSYDIRYRKGCPISFRAIYPWALGEESNEAAEEREHHFRWEVCPGSHTVVVSQILAVFVRLEFIICEY